MTKVLASIQATCSAHLRSDIEFKDWLKNHETRIQNLERWHWKVIGVISFITFMFGIVEVFKR